METHKCDGSIRQLAWPGERCDQDTPKRRTRVRGPATTLLEENYLYLPALKSPSRVYMYIPAVPSQPHLRSSIEMIDIRSRDDQIDSWVSRATRLARDTVPSQPFYLSSIYLICIFHRRSLPDIRAAMRTFLFPFPFTTRNLLRAVVKSCCDRLGPAVTHTSMTRGWGLQFGAAANLS